MDRDFLDCDTYILVKYYQHFKGIIYLQETSSYTVVTQKTQIQIFTVAEASNLNLKLIPEIGHITEIRSGEMFCINAHKYKGNE